MAQLPAIPQPPRLFLAPARAYLDPAAPPRDAAADHHQLHGARKDRVEERERQGEEERGQGAEAPCSPQHPPQLAAYRAYRPTVAAPNGRRLVKGRESRAGTPGRPSWQ